MMGTLLGLGGGGLAGYRVQRRLRGIGEPYLCPSHVCLAKRLMNGFC